MKKLIALILMIVLVSSMSACGKSDDKKDEVKQDEVVVNQDVNKEDTTIKEEEEEEKQEETKEESNLKDGMRIEFKEAMDAYEAFYDDYIEIMKKYNQNPLDSQIIDEYTQMLEDLSEMEDKFAKWEDEDLNDEEMKYYLALNERITTKLLNMNEEIESSQNKQEETKEESNLKDGMRIEFKEAMDAYEAFYDDYVDFMKKYNENPSDLTLMMELGDMTSKLSDMEDKFAKWEDEDLNDAELKYYIEVQNRVSKKLLDVATN